MDVFVARAGIHVYNGFSPNGDGINDDLVIDGLENFPKHDLTIYNPNGIEVYHTTQYKNDWGGKWTIGGKEKLLIDGTYYYVLLDGEGQKHTGYIQIQR
ncbi:MAG: gliding motility-associated C-terminal domain-containing protein [Saprospiraceae bacterium]|nr:gliding motility-associated C-terminal domain-containing protein [Saprospiraceae bacterium]